MSGGAEFAGETIEILTRLKRDSTWVFVELVDKNGWPVVKTGNERVKAKLSLSTILGELKVDADNCRVGKFYNAGDSLFYPIVAAVSEQKNCTWIYCDMALPCHLAPGPSTGYTTDRKRRLPIPGKPGWQPLDRPDETSARLTQGLTAGCKFS